MVDELLRDDEGIHLVDAERAVLEEFAPVDEALVRTGMAVRAGMLPLLLGGRGAALLQAGQVAVAGLDLATVRDQDDERGLVTEVEERDLAQDGGELEVTRVPEGPVSPVVGHDVPLDRGAVLRGAQGALVDDLPRCGEMEGEQGREHPGRGPMGDDELGRVQGPGLRADEHQPGLADVDAVLLQEQLGDQIAGDLAGAGRGLVPLGVVPAVLGGVAPQIEDSESTHGAPPWSL